MSDHISMLMEVYQRNQENAASVENYLVNKIDFLESMARMYPGKV